MPDRNLPAGAHRHDRMNLMAMPLAAALLLLAGCGDDGGADSKAAASGDVMPGSVSDAMLPLDTVRSQPPLAPHTGSSGKPEAAPSDAAPAAASDAAETASGTEAGKAETPAQTATGKDTAE